MTQTFCQVMTINVKNQQSLNVYVLIEEIWSINQDSITSMSNYIRKMIDIHYQIVEGKSTMNDTILIYANFCSFPNNNIEQNVLKTSLIEKESSLTLCSDLAQMTKSPSKSELTRKTQQSSCQIFYTTYTTTIWSVHYFSIVIM